ncbi:hypothetical protein IAU60_002192 [Kwoniella sp. DSM 27419]
MSELSRGRRRARSAPSEDNGKLKGLTHPHTPLSSRLGFRTRRGAYSAGVSPTRTDSPRATAPGVSDQEAPTFSEQRGRPPFASLEGFRSIRQFESPAFKRIPFEDPFESPKITNETDQDRSDSFLDGRQISHESTLRQSTAWSEISTASSSPETSTDSAAYDSDDPSSPFQYDDDDDEALDLVLLRAPLVTLVEASIVSHHTSASSHNLAVLATSILRPESAPLRREGCPRAAASGFATPQSSAIGRHQLDDASQPAATVARVQPTIILAPVPPTAKEFTEGLGLIFDHIDGVIDSTALQPTPEPSTMLISPGSRDLSPVALARAESQPSVVGTTTHWTHFCGVGRCHQYQVAPLEVSGKGPPTTAVYATSVPGVIAIGLGGVTCTHRAGNSHHVGRASWVSPTLPGAELLPPADHAVMPILSHIA